MTKMKFTGTLLAILLSIQDFMLPCFSKQLFGLDCPGCGLQRSLLFLVKGEFKDAFEIYPAIYAIMALVTFILFDLTMKFKYGYAIKIALSIFTIAAILVSYIIKMKFLIH